MKRRHTEQIRKRVNERIRQRAVIDNILVDLRMDLLLERDERKRAQLQARQQEYEQKLRENTTELERLEIEYQQATEAEQQIFKAAPAFEAERSQAGLLRTYLEWVYAQCSSVSLAGIDRKAVSREGDARLNLDDIYTALLTTASEQQIDKRGRDQEELRELIAEGRQEKRLSAVAQLNAHDRLVLLGDPGSGKSTFVNFAALCLAGELLQQETGEAYASLKDLTAPLPQEKQEKDSEPQPQAWEHGALLPVRIILRDFAAWRDLPAPGEALTEEHLWEFAKTQLRNAAREECLPALRTHLRQQGGLLLFDGLDEVSEAQQRRKQILGLVKRCAAEFKRCRIVVTSRTYAYQEQNWRLTGFHVAELARFSKAQIQAFVSRWYAHVGQRQGWDEEKIQGSSALLQHAIENSDRLYSFAERPLLLALMASLHAWRGGSLPEKREELYDDAVELLLDWWESQKVSRKKGGETVQEEPSLSELLKINKDRLRQVLNALAFDAHSRQPELAGAADLAEQDLVSGLMRVSQTRDLNPVQLVDYLSHRAGLLVPRGVGVYTFPHRTFQEYLAACHLTDQDDYPDNIAELARNAPNRWREVLLLAAAHASNVAPMIWALTDALCDEDFPSREAGLLRSETSPPAPLQRRGETPSPSGRGGEGFSGERNGSASWGRDVVEDAWGALLAAQAILESADLTRISSRNQIKLERIRRWLAAILTEQVTLEPGKPFPVVERALAGRLLAKLDDPRPGVGLISPPGRGQGWVPGLPDIEWREIPAGSFLMGSNESSDEQPIHQVTLAAFEMSRYPITNAQYQAFVDDGGYTEKWQNCWTDEGWKEKEENNWAGPRRFRDPFGFPNHPVVGVSWHEAVAFCNWLTIKTSPPAPLRQERGDAPPLWGGVMGGVIRLPSEAEWEYAARGPENYIYPWGNEPQPDSERANYGETNLGETSAVGCFPRGTSLFSGCEDMAGNVWEWCLDVWHDSHKGAPGDGSARQEGEKIDIRLLKGGSWYNSSGGLRCAYRLRNWRDYRDDLRGFRVVRAVGGQYSGF